MDKGTSHEPEFPDRFLGNDRHEIVDALLERFAGLPTSGPRAVTLLSPVGWGKTRIVHEFYGRLAAAQPAPPYWPAQMVADPDSAGASRKVSHPSPFEPPSGIDPPWLWWGLRCDETSDKRLRRPAFDDTEQFHVHASMLLNRRGLLSRTWASITSPEALALYGLLGFAAAPIGLGGTIGSAVKVAWDRGQDLMTRRRRDAVANRQDLRKAVKAEVELLGETLVGVSQLVPLVIFVDDAQWADPTLVALLDRLLGEGTAQILIVLTAWDDAIIINDKRSGSLPKFYADAGKRSEFIALTQLDDADLQSLILAVAPRTERSVVDLLLERAGRNPLALRLLLELPSVRSRLWDERLHLRPQEIAVLPNRLLDIYHRRWEELPDDVRMATVVAAVHGQIFCHEDVELAARRLVVVRPTAFRRAEDPYSWVRKVDDYLAEFTESTRYQAAYERRHFDFVEFDLDRVRAELVNLTIARRSAADWSDLPEPVRAQLLGNHLLLAECSVAIDLGEATTSALLLHELLLRQLNQPAAEAIAARLITLSSGRVGSNHRETFRTRVGLAVSLGQSGLVEEAAGALQELVPDCARVLGQAAVETLGARIELLGLLHDAGWLGTPLEDGRKLIRECAKALGPDHPVTLAARARLVVWLVEAGASDDALAEGREVVDSYVRVFGRRHPETLGVGVNYLNALAQHRPAGLAVWNAAAMAIECDEILGSGHPITLVADTNHAIALWGLGHVDEAISIMVNVSRTRDDVLGPGHPDSLRARAIALEWTWRAGTFDRDRVVVVFGELVRRYEEVLGADHRETRLARHTLAEMASPGRGDM